MKYRFVILMTALCAMPVVAVTLFALTDGFDTNPLPIYGDVPEFRLVERSGELYGSKELERKVWVASFVFTSCNVQCPRIAQRVQTLMRKLRFKENMRLVSFSVDPERDTPEVLRKYADQYQADPYKWLFLTGEKKTVNALIQNGFRLAADADGGDIIHSEKLVLVDGWGKIRGYYDANDDRQMKQLQRDTRRMLKETTYTP